MKCEASDAGAIGGAAPNTHKRTGGTDVTTNRPMRGLLVAAVALVLGPTAQMGWSDDAAAQACTNTAKAARTACFADQNDDFWIARANCINLSDPGERAACREEARTERREGKQLCKDQFAARRDLCAALGESRYDPDFDPANFVNPLDIGGGVAPNRYFPLIPGTRWVYEGGSETVTVTVTEETKLIEGVTCLVVNDVVTEDGQPIEDTDDWYAQDLDGNVWYCGEIAQNLETIEGDDPELPELVDIDGSWKTGRDGAKPGIIMFASPQVGDVYRQELSLGEAEDAAEVIDTEGSATTPSGESCDGDCVVTRDFTPLEPDAVEHKYYAPGVGPILEENPETGEVVELIEFTAP